jgi:hypothetical protein
MELRRARALLRRHFLRVFDTAPVLDSTFVEKPDKIR